MNLARSATVKTLYTVYVLRVAGLPMCAFTHDGNGIITLTLSHSSLPTQHIMKHLYPWQGGGDT